MIENLSGVIAAICSTLSFVPQVYKVYRARSAKDISTATFFLIFIGSLAWISYGLVNQLPSVIFTNISMGLSAFLILVAKVIFGARLKQADYHTP